jgi:hypothetical protein
MSTSNCPFQLNSNWSQHRSQHRFQQPSNGMSAHTPIPPGVGTPALGLRAGPTPGLGCQAKWSPYPYRRRIPYTPERASLSSLRNGGAWTARTARQSFSALTSLRMHLRAPAAPALRQMVRHAPGDEAERRLFLAFLSATDKRIAFRYAGLILFHHAHRGLPPSLSPGRAKGPRG